MINSYTKRSLKLQRQEALCIATAMSFAAVISFCYKTNQAYWLITTVGLMFSVPARGMILRRFKHRIIGTFTGLMLSFLFINTFIYADYRWCYLVPVIYLIVNYLLIVTSIYAVAVFAISLLVPILQVILGTSSFSLDTTLIKRLEFTIIGVLIALLCEYIIYKKATLSLRKYKFNIYSHFSAIGEIIESCSECFVRKKRMTNDLILKLQNSYNTKASIDSMYQYLKIEFEYEENRTELMEYTFNQFSKINESIRKLICIVNHESFNDTEISKIEFTELCKKLADKYKTTIKYVSGKKLENYKINSKLNKKIKNDSSFLPTSFYLDEVLNLDKLFNEYIKKFQKPINLVK